MVLSDHIGCVLGKAVVSLALCTRGWARGQSLLYTVSLGESSMQQRNVNAFLHAFVEDALNAF